MKHIKQNSLIVVIFSFLVCCLSCGQKVPAFDGNRAFAYLTAQTDFGPRNPGSEGHKKCLDYLVAELKKYADMVNTQPFVFNDTFTNQTFELTNIIASFNLNPKNNQRILLLSHWDTRPRRRSSGTTRGSRILRRGTRSAAATSASDTTTRSRRP
jgi:hypothetical protein